MREYSFEIRADREGTDSLKESITPDAVKKAGLPSYLGAEFEFPTCPAFSEGVMECAKRGVYPFTLQSEAYNERVAWWLEAVRGWKIRKDWIVPTGEYAGALRPFTVEDRSSAPAAHAAYCSGRAAGRRRHGRPSRAPQNSSLLRQQTAKRSARPHRRERSQAERSPRAVSSSCSSRSAA